MDSKVTLKSIFVLNKGELSAKLDGLCLPKDSQQVQNVVTDFLDNMFENDGQFRQTLTESEDFLLQASLRLLQAQQNIALEFAKASKDAIQQNGICRNITQSQKSPTSSMYISAAGAGVGAFAGGFLGTWAAVAGAIAGTALVIYCSTRPSNNSSMSNAGLSSPSINVSCMSKCSLSKQRLRNSCIPPSTRVITSEVSACDDTDIASNNAGTTNILFIIKT